jgi:hypothetical protein
MAFPLLSLLLLAAAQADAPAAVDGPIKTTAPTPAEAAATSPLAEFTPPGAPQDDYAFVAWCDGVLSGHMDLAERVRDVLPLDEVQQKVGKAYLHGYEVALAKGEKGRSPEALALAKAAREQGWMNWEPTRKADKKLAADSYLAWQLPGRCEHAAVRVSGDKNLFRSAPSFEDVAAMGVETPIGSGPAAEPAPEAPARDAAPPAPEAATVPAAPVAGAPAAGMQAAAAPAAKVADAVSTPEAADQVRAALEAAKVDATPATPAALDKAEAPKPAPRRPLKGLLSWFRKL